MTELSVTDAREVGCRAVGIGSQRPRPFGSAQGRLCVCTERRHKDGAASTAARAGMMARRNAGRSPSAPLRVRMTNFFLGGRLGNCGALAVGVLRCAQDDRAFCNECSRGGLPGGGDRESKAPLQRVGMVEGGGEGAAPSHREEREKWGAEREKFELAPVAAAPRPTSRSAREVGHLLFWCVREIKSVGARRPTSRNAREVGHPLFWSVREIKGLGARLSPKIPRTEKPATEWRHSRRTLVAYCKKAAH
jgi:hypothetical protein